MSILSWLLLIGFSIGITILLLCVKYPMLWLLLKILFTRFHKGTFSYWKYHEYRHQKLESKGKFSDKLFAKQYVESIYCDMYDINIKCAKLLLEGVPTIKDLKELKQIHKHFVIKANHGWHQTIVVKKDDDLKEQDMMKYIHKCSSWLKQSFGNTMIHKLVRCQELQYSYIQPKVFIEECLGENMTDYKLHTIHGKVEFMEVVFDRDIGQAEKSSTNVYGVNPWRLLEGVYTTIYNCNDSGTKIDEPTQLQTMIAFAEAFTKTTKFEYCRVDLYIVRNQVYFGEFTFSPSANVNRFYPLSFDQYLYEKVLEK
eukprot:91544_1